MIFSNPIGKKNMLQKSWLQVGDSRIAEISGFGTVFFYSSGMNKDLLIDRILHPLGWF